MKKHIVNLKFIFVCLLFCTVLVACSGKKEEKFKETEEGIRPSNIFYHADDGELDTNAKDKVINMTKEQAEEAGKTIITFVISGSENSTLIYPVKGFNQESGQYFVDLQIVPVGAKLADERLKLQIEVGAGGGPDIMSEDVFPVNMKLLEKGAFVDLAPYMKESEITEEKYFPCYANLKYGEKIYGICPTGFVNLWTIDKKVFGGRDTVDIYEFVDFLKEYPEDASLFYSGESGNSIVQYLLQGSGSLWGMVDWEKRKCDFSGEFFADILQVAKRYSENGQKGFEPLMTYANAYPGLFPGNEALAEKGMTLVGNFYDDGCFPTYNDGGTFMINANSKNIDGAWSFLSYLMSKKGQNIRYANSSAHKELFIESLQESIRLAEEGKYFFSVDMNFQIMDDIIDIYNRGRYLPRQNEEILAIIWEETERYFEGDKDIVSVCNMIQNRVQLMLNE